MSTLRIFAFTALFFSAISFIPQEAQANSGIGFSVGYHPRHHYYRPYYYRPYYYRPYYYPFYGGFYHPYSFGYGYAYPYYNYYVASIRTEVKPEEANVFVDGDYAGVADDFDGWWQRLDVEPGRHRLVFRAPGFAPYVVDIHAAPGRDAHIKYEMVPGEDQIADLEMRLPQEENRPYGDDPQRQYRRREYRRPPPPGYDQDRYEERDRYREEDRNQYDDRDSGYNSNRSSLLLNVDPPDATVYIDGNYYGTANENGRGQIRVLLPEGVHRVEVVRPGFNSYSQDVTISREGENQLTISLEKK
jgi:hypothetical protein